MDGFSTITQKGQVAIPKSIRDYFSLKPFDKVHFAIENNKIVAEPILGLADMRGFIPAKKSLSKAEIKKIVQKSVLRKYESRS